MKKTRIFFFGVWLLGMTFILCAQNFAGFSDLGFNSGGASASPPVVSYHTTVVAWASQVAANGGAAPSAATKSALSDFCTGLDTDGLSTNLLSVCCFVPDNLTAAITPLIATKGSVIWTNHGFVSSDLNTNGLKGTGTAWLDTSVSGIDFPSATNAGVSMLTSEYVTENIYQFGFNFADEDQAAVQLYEDIGEGNNESYVRFWAQYSDAQAAATGWQVAMFISGNRTAANVITLYGGTNGVLSVMGTGSATYGSPFDAHLYFFTENVSGSPGGGCSSRRYSFAACHAGLTGTQVTNLYTRVRALRTALGGGSI